MAQAGMSSSRALGGSGPKLRRGCGRIGDLAPFAKRFLESAATGLSRSRFPWIDPLNYKPGRTGEIDGNPSCDTRRGPSRFIGGAAEARVAALKAKNPT